jgi:ribosomal protein L11 methyltransferase
MFICRKLTFKISEDAKSLVSDFLLGFHSMGVAEDIVEDKGMVEISAYFPAEADLNMVKESFKNYCSFLGEYLPAFSLGDIDEEEIDRSSWEGWRQFLKTVRVSERVIVRPPWEEYLPHRDEIVIEINPSMAFGTGHHETTRLCIRAMEEMMQNKKVGSVLDVGCGSGILAISAVKLGSDWALGLDDDPIAVKEAKENLERNSVSDRVGLFRGQIENMNGKFDLIVMNISAEAALRYGASIKSRLNSKGILIVSGITNTRSDEVVSTLEGMGFNLDSKMTDGEWVALVFGVDKSAV